MTAGSILRYDAARQALAEARTIDEVKDWEDKAAAVREYARRANNRDMEIDAAEIRVRAQRRRGELLAEMRATGVLSEGRKKWSSADDHSKPVTLADLNTTKNESSNAQKLAAIEPDAFERLAARCRATMEDERSVHSFDVLRERDGPVNGARSVMGSRQESDDSLDFSPTPPWATRALLEIVLPQTGAAREFASAWDPACGEGHMTGVLEEYPIAVVGTDIFDYSDGSKMPPCWLRKQDFLDKKAEAPVVDWIVTNPPFGDKTEPFVLRALELASVGVAMFVRLQWLESIGRYEAIFRDRPPTIIAFFAERVPLHMGRWEPDGATATAYIWLVWKKGAAPRAPFWIPPGQRKALERSGDRERFTAHPVLAKSPLHDPDTGEIIEPEAASTDAASIPMEQGNSRNDADRSEAELRNAGGSDDVATDSSAIDETTPVQAAGADVGDTASASVRDIEIHETSPSIEVVAQALPPSSPAPAMDGEAQSKTAKIAALKQAITTPTDIEPIPDILQRVTLDKQQRTILMRINVEECDSEERSFIGRLRRDTNSATVTDCARLSSIAKSHGLTTEQQL